MPQLAEDHTQLSGGVAPVNPPMVVCESIGKRFAGAVALDSVSLDVRTGEVHSIIGANGAGKSTLGKVLAGVHAHDSGRLLIDGEPAAFRSPADALARGIAIMQQEIALAGKLSVIDNVFLGTEFGTGPLVNRRAQRLEYEQLCQRTGFLIDPDVIVDELRLGEQQQVSVLWALARHARIVVMDEPTASLDREDSQRLVETARRLAAEGIGVVFVSHFLDEVLALSDRITVLENGRHVFTRDRSELSESALVEAMVGGSFEAAFPQLPARPGADVDPVFSAEDIALDGMLHGLSLDVRPGEIVGVYGLVGSGRSEFALAISGGLRASSGVVRIAGDPVRVHTPQAALDAGITLLPESRKDQGLMLNRSVLENTALSALGRFTSRLGIVKRRELSAAVEEVLNPLSLRGGNRLSEDVGNFSGGNQQKVLLGKCLLTKPKLLILDEPTRGVDIGAKRAIYDVIVSIAAAGTAIILISSEEAEVMHLSHRIAVFREGRIVDRVDHADVNESRLLAAALGAGTTTTGEKNGK